MKITEILSEAKKEAPKPRNFVAKNAINTGAGAHKDKKKAEKQGDVKHKKEAIPMDESHRDNRDAYQRDYDSSVSGMGRGHDHRGLGQELAHERNNLAISINGKVWKVVPGRGTADSFEERQYLRHMQDWAEKKSAKSGKKWSVYTTGADVTNESIAENATAGATSAGSIATVDAPHISPGKSRGKRSYTGSPSTGSGTKAPAQPKVVQPKTSAGTAVNGLDIKGKSLFGGPANEGAVIKRR